MLKRFKETALDKECQGSIRSNVHKSIEHYTELEKKKARAVCDGDFVLSNKDRIFLAESQLLSKFLEYLVGLKERLDRIPVAE